MASRLFSGNLSQPIIAELLGMPLAIEAPALADETSLNFVKKGQH